MKHCVLLLAAGQATRFGADKRVATMLEGMRVIDAVLEQIHLSGLPCRVCLGARDALAPELARRGVALLHCPRAHDGMGSTLADGVSQLAGFDGVLIALADMPWIRASTFAAVAAGLRADRICVPRDARGTGHPVGFSARYFPELAALRGDAGARRVLHKHAARVDVISVDDAGIHRDIDRPADLRLGTGR